MAITAPPIVLLRFENTLELHLFARKYPTVGMVVAVADNPINHSRPRHARCFVKMASFVDGVEEGNFIAAVIVAPEVPCAGCHQSVAAVLRPMDYAAPPWGVTA
jgi:hypothetical protein